MFKLSRFIYLNDETNLQKDDYNSYSFARGYDDFVVTWPPPSTNTTSINDDK